MKSKNKKNEVAKKSPKNEFIEQAQLEERKFSYINPVINEDLNTKYIFWNDTIEKYGRILILVGRLLAYCLAIGFIIGFKNNAINSGMGAAINDFFKKYGDYIIIIVVILETFISFVYIIPQVTVKRANSLHSWGIAYVYLGIFYFLIWELIFVVSSILEGLNGSDSSGLWPVSVVDMIMMFLILMITIILITGGCLLIHKSDDIRRKATTE